MNGYEASLIAKYFISKSTPGTKQNITNLKLQKMLYYAQGFYYSLENKRLFKEEIHAWAHGPVVKEIYHEYKVYNFNEIDSDIDANFDMLSTDDKIFLDKVWEMFKNFSGKQLEYLTHQEDPWKKARKGIDPGKKSDDKIDLEEIKSYFQSHYMKQEQKQEVVY